MIKIALLSILVVLLICVSYYKGYNDHRLESLSIGMSENYITLMELDKGDVKLAKSNLFVALYGEHQSYVELSKNILLKQPIQSDPRLSGRFNDIDSYLKKTAPEMWPQN
jgi:hypothetical protein